MTNRPNEGAPAIAEPAPPLSDERLRREGRLRRAFGRPELGALAGTLLVFLFFGDRKSVVEGNSVLRV